MMESVTKRWGQLDAQIKQYVVYGLIGLVVFGLGVLVWNAGEQPGPSPTAQRIAKDLLPKDAARTMGVSGIGQDVDELRTDIRVKNDQIAKLQSKVEELSQHAPAGADSSPNTKNELQSIREEIERMKKPTTGVEPGNGGRAATFATGTTGIQTMAPPGGAVTTPGYGSASRPGTANSNYSAAPTPPVPTSIRTITEKSTPSPSASTNGAPAARMLDKDGNERVPTNYIPSGSILTGVVITGLDAPTGKNAMQDPIPMLIRIKHDAILPNRYRADVKECFLLASGHGDLASERAYLRAVSVSCIRTDKKVIDVKVEMYAVGGDGKAGIRGRLVSKQGQIIAKASLAGLAQGFSQAFGSSNYSYGNYGNGGGVDYGRAGQMGLGMGVGSAFDRIAKYYLDLADQVFPVIEIDAGQKVSFVMVKGESMGVLR